MLLSGKACLALAAQEVEAPSVSKPVPAQSQPAGTATSANDDIKIAIGGRGSNSQTASTAKTASADDDHHGLRIEIGGSDTSVLTPEVRAQLSPEQLYKLEIARLESKKGGVFEEDIIIPLSFFGLILAIIGLVSWARFRRNRLTHETVRLLVEKGQPIPPEMFRENQKLPAPDRTLQKGIIWTALGVGLTGFFMIGSGNWGIGLIPLCIGLGYLLTWKLESDSKPGTGA